MSWVAAVEALRSAYDFQEGASLIGSMVEHGKKLAKAKEDSVSAGDAGFVDQKALKKLKTLLTDMDGKLDTVGSYALHEPDTKQTWAAWGAACAKRGSTSKEARAALQDYVKDLTAYDKILAFELTAVKRGQGKYAQQIKIVEGLAASLETLSEVAMTCAELPAFGGTAQNAIFFTLSQNAAEMASLASSVAGKLNRLSRDHDAVVAEVEDRIKQNKLWITWAEKDAARSADAFKKNSKAETPR